MVPHIFKVGSVELSCITRLNKFCWYVKLFTANSKHGFLVKFVKYSATWSINYTCKLQPKSKMLLVG